MEGGNYGVSARQSMEGFEFWFGSSEKENKGIENS